MNNSSTRTNFYILSGITSTLIGWSLSYLILDLIQLFLPPNFNFNLPPYSILLVTITPSIATAMVVAEIFLSNPTHNKANWRILSRTILRAVIIAGLICGLLLSLLNWLLLESNWPGFLVKMISWGLIGLFAGLAESISWSFRSIEGTASKVKQRIAQSTLLGGSTGLVSALFFEMTHRVLGKYQEPFGFLVFGACLGLALSFTARTSYQVALRAGQGFEAIKPKKKVSEVYSTVNIHQEKEVRDNNSQQLRPCLQNKSLKFVPDDEFKYIEEGLSIQLPLKTHKPIIIGSSEDADIYIPYIPLECASLQFKDGNLVIRSFAEEAVRVQQRWVPEGRTIILRHNQILTLYHEHDTEKFYRFVFYDRFLDPQA